MSLSTPVEIDTAIAAQSYVVQKVERQVLSQERHAASKDAYLHSFFDEAKYADLLTELDTEQTKLNELQDQYTGWPRYWHVTNNNGHIHTSMHCTSCFPDTQYGWRIDLSGLTPEQVVEREDYNACSVCMPIAPAEQRAARQRYTEQQRQARKDERQQKADEKLRKAAERAQKLLAKVDTFYEAQGGYEAVMAWDSHAIYNAQWTHKLQQTVWEVVYDDWHERNETNYRSSQPRQKIQEARERGLID